jgi:hypothetical protein
MIIFKTKRKRYIFWSLVITFLGIFLSLVFKIFNDYLIPDNRVLLFHKKELWWVSSSIFFISSLSFQINFFLLIINFLKLRNKKISENINFNSVILGFSMTVIYFLYLFPELFHKRLVEEVKKLNYSSSENWIRISWWILATSTLHLFSPLFFFIAFIKNKKIKKLKYKENMLSVFWKRRTLFFPYAYFFFALMIRNLDLKVSKKKVKEVLYSFLKSNSYLEILFHLFVFTLIVFAVTLFVLLINNIIFYILNQKNNSDKKTN